MKQIEFMREYIELCKRYNLVMDKDAFGQPKIEKLCEHNIILQDNYLFKLQNIQKEIKHDKLKVGDIENFIKENNKNYVVISDLVAESYSWDFKKEFEENIVIFQDWDHYKIREEIEKYIAENKDTNEKIMLCYRTYKDGWVYEKY